MKKLLTIIVIGLIVWFLHGTIYKRALLPAEQGSEQRVTFKVEEGWSLTRIADALEEKEIIRSSSALRKYAKKQDVAQSLKAGEYVLGPGMSVAEIVALMAEGQSSEVKVTIPEGYTIAQIDALLVSKGLGQSGDILHCAFTCDFSSFEFLPKQNFASEKDGYGSKVEGYVFPDTYFASREDYVPKFFLERMLATFRTRVADGMKTEIDDSDRSIHEIVTMASLIEEETRTDDERPMVSGILWKRFNEGMGLDVDATIRYITSNISNAITQKELDTSSPYNTRKFRGLPPGPIASPGLSAFEAALNPEDSEYWYYLHGNDGQIRYAKTNDEHNQNKARYLR